ncbi:pantoate--beta-alanine ligase [Bacillus sp. FJAT-45037]|uniref:pantoate--beta-alanine ligase n=1 Tax=Bacillus sp. FJAT-45037 TaxID=2011007 RepID=UPI000C23566A|nr:pantoate--beta-alanine ligase [Bacillus sp. FJAT-45037]
MNIVKTIHDLQEKVTSFKNKDLSIGFVPTMGYLHEGHISLLKEARNNHDVVVLSIFVNPLQFGPNEDLDRYPRDFNRDEELAREAGVDLLFYPSVEEMYPGESSMIIHVKEGVDVLCGASRPGHFDGVATVVMKLLMLVQPDQAFFGQKDAQQVAIITNMVQMFNVPVKIVPVSTVREEDGLAKSSRNVYLSETERKEAPIIFQTLERAREKIKAGEHDGSVIVNFVKDELRRMTLSEIDYVELVSYPALRRVEKIEETVLLAVACKFKQARLIDNFIVTRSES